MTLIHSIAHPGGEEPLPALIALHGYGAHGQDLLGLSPYLAHGRLLMICPQAPLSIEPGLHGFSWYPFPGPGGAADEDEIERAIALIRDFIDFALEAYPVQRDRVALLGFSQGGGMAYRVGYREPERFVGLAALSTSLPADVFADGPPGEAAAALPVIIQHGVDDTMASIDRGRASNERLRSLGLEPDYREYPMMGHEIGGGSAGDLSDWLERVLRLEETAEPPPGPAPGP